MAKNTNIGGMEFDISLNLEALQKGQEKLKIEMKKIENASKDVKKGLDNLEGSLENVAKESIAVAEATKKEQAELKKTQDAAKKLEQQEKSLENQKKKLRDAMVSLSEKTARATIALTAFGVASGVVAKKVLTVAGAYEQQKVAFEVLIGSVEEAKKFMADLSDFALVTPFEIQGVRETAKQFLAYGLAQKDVIPTMRMLGDLSLGNSEKFERLAYAYGQVRSAGKLYATEARQFTEATVPIYETLTKYLGKEVNVGNIGEMEISFDEVRAALEKMTEKGGRFFGLMEKGAKTLPGIWNNIKDAFTKFQEKFEETKSYQALKDGLNKVFQFVDTELPKTFGKVDAVITGVRENIYTIAGVIGAVLIPSVVRAGIALVAMWPVALLASVGAILGYHIQKMKDLESAIGNMKRASGEWGLFYKKDLEEISLLLDSLGKNKSIEVLTKMKIGDSSDLGKSLSELNSKAGAALTEQIRYTLIDLGKQYGVSLKQSEKFVKDTENALGKLDASNAKEWAEVLGGYLDGFGSQLEQTSLNADRNFENITKSQTKLDYSEALNKTRELANVSDEQWQIIVDRIAIRAAEAGNLGKAFGIEMANGMQADQVFQLLNSAGIAITNELLESMEIGSAEKAYIIGLNIARQFEAGVLKNGMQGPIPQGKELLSKIGGTEMTRIQLERTIKPPNVASSGGSSGGSSAKKETEAQKKAKEEFKRLDNELEMAEKRLSSKREVYAKIAEEKIKKYGKEVDETKKKIEALEDQHSEMKKSVKDDLISLQEELKNLQKSYDDSLKDLTDSFTKEGAGKLVEYQAKLKELQAEMRNMSPNDSRASDVAREIDEIQRQIDSASGMFTNEQIKEAQRVSGLTDFQKMKEEFDIKKKELEAELEQEKAIAIEKQAILQTYLDGRISSITNANTAENTLTLQRLQEEDLAYKTITQGFLDHNGVFVKSLNDQMADSVEKQNSALNQIERMNLNTTSHLIEQWNAVKAARDAALGAAQAIGADIGTQQYASGGFVRGPGNGTSDSIPARLSNGEFVVNARSTALMRPLLTLLNNAKSPSQISRIPRFAEGGFVGATNETNNITNSTNIEVNAQGITDPQAIGNILAWHKRF
jgi:tape measure domain-containing protein